MSVYYDEEGDYLEIFIEGSSPTYGEEIGDDITLLKPLTVTQLRIKGSRKSVKKSLYPFISHPPFV